MEQTIIEQTPVEQTRVESKLYIKLNEEESNVDFTLFVPKNCNYEHAKKGALGAYEHIVRLENEAIRLQKEKEAEVSETQVSETQVSEAQVLAEPVTEVVPEVVGE